MTFNIFMSILIVSFILFLISRYILKIFRDKEFNSREKQLLDNWESGDFLDGDPEVIKSHGDSKFNSTVNKSDDRII